jgi:hypothetical protein
VGRIVVPGEPFPAEDPLRDQPPAPVLSGTSGDKPTQLAITSEAERVIIRFPEPKLWVALDVTGARNLADALKAEAERVKPSVSEHRILDRAANRMRDRLVVRVSIMLNSMDRKKKKTSYQAGAIVDQVLSAVNELADRYRSIL